MTSQTYTAGHDQLAPDNDLMVREDHQMAAEPNPVVQEDSPMVPDGSPIEPAADQVMPADEQLAEGASSPDPAAGWVAAASGSPATAIADPRFAPAMPVALVFEASEEPGADQNDAASPPADPVSAAESQSVPESLHAIDGRGTGARWHEIQAMFVDDPRASVELASRLVDDKVETLVISVRDRQQSLQAAWLGAYTGTEELRMALQNYRAFWNRLEDLPVEV